MDEVELPQGVTFFSTVAIPTDADGLRPYFESAQFYGMSQGNRILRGGCKHGHSDLEAAIACAEQREVTVIVFVNYRPQHRAQTIGKRSKANPYDVIPDSTTRADR